MEDYEKPTIGCRITLSVGGDLGCQLCWIQRRGDKVSSTRQDCMRLNIVDLKKKPEKLEKKHKK